MLFYDFLNSDYISSTRFQRCSMTSWIPKLYCLEDSEVVQWCLNSYVILSTWFECCSIISGFLNVIFYKIPKLFCDFLDSYVRLSTIFQWCSMTFGNPMLDILQYSNVVLCCSGLLYDFFYKTPKLFYVVQDSYVPTSTRFQWWSMNVWIPL